MAGGALLEELMPDDLIVQVLSFVATPHELGKIESINRRFRRLPTFLLWHNLCRLTFPHQCCSQDDDSLRDFDWKVRFRFLEQDLRRTELTCSDLEGLEWQFHFIQPHDRTSGNDSATTQTRLPQESPAYFVNGRLYILKYLWRFALLEIELLQYTDDGVNENDEAQIVSNHLWENRQYPHLVQALELAGLASLSSMENHSDDTIRCSYRQCLRIADFALHSIARTRQGGWIIWNKHVVLVSTGKRRGKAPLPEELQKHIALLQSFDW